MTKSAATARGHVLLLLVLAAWVIVGPAGSASAAAAPKPTNGRIYFSGWPGAYTDQSGASDIYSVKPNGRGIRNVTQLNGTDGSLTEPSASAHGKEVAFVKTGCGIPCTNIMAMHGDGSHIIFVAAHNGRITDNGPAITPNGTRVVFSRLNADTGGQDLYLAHLNGSGPRNLTHTGGAIVETEPEWSPNVKKIVYTRTVGAVSQIWVMNADGSGQHALTTNMAGADTSPAWSPSGQKIVYRSSGNTPSTRDGLYVMNKNGSKRARLLSATHDGINGWDPTWSPDGKRIAFAARGAYRGWADDDICLIPATGRADPICPKTSLQVGGDYPTWAAKPTRK